MVNSIKPLVYTGTKQPSPTEYESKRLSPYKPSPELIEAVKLTIFLKKRPLLLKGEPGCGKTCLAQAVAYELGLPYESWYIKSTTKAKDGFYSYDAVGRLHDAQLARRDEQQQSKVDDLSKYIKLGPLGRAFQNDQRTVVLIDEIDKADLDFPNDLLQELDEKRFMIQEMGEEIKAKHPPIIFITSNDEKDLPDAFLRRCLFHYIDFPYEQLGDIIKLHFPDSSEEEITEAVISFTKLRRRMEKDSGRTGKKVSTSELIDWFTLLRQYPEENELAKLDRKLPFAGALLKYWKDYRQYQNTP
ncbi:AAA family ATPase [Nostoc sp.]|uniref:AAA family ATPase n=1 Tax=Nostoc sp. TaxID=1180 RepID=UPI003593B80D